MDLANVAGARGGHSLGASGFRADLESLRAVAILSVVVFHAAPGVLAGGFVGVDVFFVLSGFLITQILVRELLTTGRIDLMEFWARRARRILPAASLVLVATALACALLLSPLDLRSAYQDIMAAAAYFINWRLAFRAVDYLAQDEGVSVALHYWSLSVEEQFYIGWPLIAALAAAWAGRKAGRSLAVALLAVTAMLWLASLSLAAALTWSAQPFAFFGTLSRVWQLLTGAALAIAAGSVGAPLLPPRWRQPAAVAGLAMVIAACVLLSRDTAYPGFAALVPTLGSALVVAAHVSTRDGLGRLLGLAPLRYIGRVSYSWYLWHWPVLMFGQMLLPGASLAGRLLLVVLALGLAAATHHLVENPVRFAPALVRSPMRSIAMGAAAMALCFISAGGLAWVAAGSRIMLRDGTTLTLAAVKSDLPRPNAPSCPFGAPVTPACLLGDRAGTRLAVLVGDSHAAQWLPALERAAAGEHWRLLLRTRSACPAIDVPVFDRRRNREDADCAAFRRKVLDEIADLRPDAVFVASYSYDNAASAAVALSHTLEAHGADLAAGERRYLQAIARSARKTFVLRDNPAFRTEPTRCLLEHPRRDDACRWPLAELGNDAPYPTADLAGLRPGVEVVEIGAWVCPNAICAAATDGIVMMRDTHHLTASFAARFAPQFRRLLSSVDRPPPPP